MPDKKKRGRPKVDKPKNKIAPIKFDEDELAEKKAIAKSEGYTFSGWVKMLIEKEIKRIKRRKK